MKKVFLAAMLAGGFAGAFAQKTPPRPHHPHHPPHERGDHPTPPDAPPRPLTPKEVWQKMKTGKKKMDARSEADRKYLEAEAAKRK